MFSVALPLLKQSSENLTETNVVNRKIKFKGICLAFLQAQILLCINTLVKKMELNVGDVLFIRSIVLILAALMIVIKTKKSIWLWEVDEGKSINQLRTLLILYAIFVGIFNLCELIAIYLCLWVMQWR